MASLVRTSDRIMALQNKRLRRLVSYAYENVAYYRWIFDEARVAPGDIRTVSDLLAIPITSREDVRDSAVQHVVARHADPRRLLTWNTSGSSGMPLDIRRTWLEERTLNMVRLRAYREIGLRARDRIASIQRPRPTGPNDHQWLHRTLRTLGLYRRFPISCFDAGDEIARKLTGTKPDVIFGSPGVVSLVAQHIDSTIRRHVQPRFIGVGGEVLTPSMREQIYEGFGAPVFDTYASYEFNLMAWECADTGRMHVCDDSVIVEVIKDGRRVAPGERGEVVATALHSFAMPFIRYRLGDMVMRGETACPCGAPYSTIMEIQGRVIDHFVLPDGRVVNPYAVTGPLKRSAPWIKQFQLTQESEDQFIFRVVPATRPSRQDLASLAVCAEAIVGPEVRFETRLVPEIPLEASGKFRVCRSFASAPHGSLEEIIGKSSDGHSRPV